MGYSMHMTTGGTSWLRVYCNRSTIGYWSIHLAALVGVLVTGASWRGLGLAVLLYIPRMFFVTAAYHRYFSHRSFKTSRWFQFVLALGATLTGQKGPLWWASNHRAHHKHSDSPSDVHSAAQGGFWWAHHGWITAGRDVTDYAQIKDFAKYPELRFINKHDWIAPWTLGVISYLIAGWSGLVVGFFGSTILLWHGTFCINSLAHVFGRRRYDTPDTSRNSFLLALFTGGEGWHNNHHHYQASARQGFYWWEIDPVFMGLRVLSWFGIVRDLKTPPRQIRDAR